MPNGCSVPRRGQSNCSSHPEWRIWTRATRTTLAECASFCCRLCGAEVSSRRGDSVVSHYRLLLRHAVNRPQPPHQRRTVDPQHQPVREQTLQRIESELVVLV